MNIAAYRWRNSRHLPSEVVKPRRPKRNSLDAAFRVRPDFKRRAKGCHTCHGGLVSSLATTTCCSRNRLRPSTRMRSLSALPGRSNACATRATARRRSPALYSGLRLAIRSDGCLSKLDDRSGSITEVANHDSDVRYAPKSGSRETPVACPLCAKRRHWQFPKSRRNLAIAMSVEEQSTASTEGLHQRAYIKLGA